MYERYLQLNVKNKQTAFLWGARKTGKSTYLKFKFPNSLYIDLLKTDLYLRYLKQPFLLRQEILALDKEQLEHPIIIDEVQKVPAILDEVHWLIENKEAYFILCGSSARKLKQTGVNLLGGRAIKYNFFPLVYSEIQRSFDLIRVFYNGLIPAHYMNNNPRRLLKAYVEDYLTQEIQFEGLVRNLPAFTRFIDSIAFNHGEMINYSNIARDCAIDSKTVKEYYQILVDTLVGYLIYPYKAKSGRDIISAAPKFYFFDTGVVNRILNRRITELKGIEAGKCLEHYIFLELKAYIGLNDLDYEIYYWRTKIGTEVDFIIKGKNNVIPIEVKISSNIHNSELKGLKSFMLEYQIKKSYIVSLEPAQRLVASDKGEILIMPTVKFLEKLWVGEIL